MASSIDFKTLAGSNPWIVVEVNGNRMTPDELVNKTNEFVLRGGMDLMWHHSGRWRVLYSPDFKLALTSKDRMGVAAKDQPYRYVWDITKYVRPGKNQVRVHALKILPNASTMVFRDVHRKDLVLVELKRGKLAREHRAQLRRYMDHARESAMLRSYLEDGDRLRGVLATVEPCEFDPRSDDMSVKIVDRKKTVKVLKQLRDG